MKHESPSFPARPEGSTKHVPALIRLLSDPDPRVAQRIHRQLVDVGRVATPFLQQACIDVDDPLMVERLQAVNEEIDRAEIERRWGRLLQQPRPEVDLEAGAFLIAQAAEPQLAVPFYQQRLDDVAAALKQTVDPSRDPRHAVLTINEYLFHTLKFRGNTRTYYDPDNSFLHRVLDRRVGIPISLSVLYILVSRRLNLPVVGVGMPGHFIVRLRTQPVFIDCFHQGALLTPKACEKLLQPYGVEFDRRHLEPCSSDQILARMLRNLIAIFENRREFTNGEKFYRLFAMLENRAEFSDFR